MKQPLPPRHPTYLEKPQASYAEQDQGDQSQEEEDGGGAEEQQRDVQSQPAAPARGEQGGWGGCQALVLLWERVGREPWGALARGCWSWGMAGKEDAGPGCLSWCLTLTSGGRWCETAALLPCVREMGLGPWLRHDLQEGDK